MGFWVNNFIEFEKKRKRKNRMILNFLYIPDKGEEGRSVKVYVPKEISVASDFISREKQDNIIRNIKKKEIKVSKIEKDDGSLYGVLKITMPNDPVELKKLPKTGLQTGNHAKIAKFEGFYPYSRVSFHPEIYSKLFSGDELELDSLDRIYSSDKFMSADKLRSLNSMVLDIEKPLWKKDDEKELLDKKKKLLKEQKKGKNVQDKINDLEKKLIYHAEGVGEVNLSDERFNADISFMTIIFNNKDKISKEMYIIDPRKEIKYSEYMGYKLFMFENEKDLIEHSLKRFKENKVLVSHGHNQVYDISQIRFTADEKKLMFDSVIKDIKPKRDFVRSHVQRLKENFIYIDTLWMNKILHPYLSQKSLDTSFKLADVAKFYDIKFEKSLTHEELRDVELRRLVGRTKKIREKAIDEMLYYAAKDVDVTHEIVEKMNPWDFLVEMKKLLPFCTYSEIAFSPNIMNRLHEFRHFEKNGNFPYYKYKQKQRRDELQIFKKRFISKKRKLLKKVGLKKASNKEYKNVKQYYVPLEKWVRNLAFSVDEKLEEAYEKTKDNPVYHLGFLQDLKSYFNAIFIDHYFAEREGEVSGYCLDFLPKVGLRSDEGLKNVISAFGYEKLEEIQGNFHFLKNHFRSIYVDLNGKDRAKIRKTDKNLSERGQLCIDFEEDNSEQSLDYPLIAKHDADLYLLRKNADNVNVKKEINLTTFLNSFNKFESRIKEKDKILNGHAFDLVYCYLYGLRAQKAKDKFMAKYGYTLDYVSEEILNGYMNLASEIKDKKVRFLKSKGDYIFVQGEEELDSCIKVRDLETFVVD